VPETTVQGVSLFTKERGRHADIFDLALTYVGIEIRRPGESARLLSWERVSEWEIEERRGGVLLTLRGGGSVTPLIIPRWKVDDLDLILRDVTSHSVWLEPEVLEEPEGEGGVEPEDAPTLETAAAVAVAVAVPEAEVEVEAEPEAEPQAVALPEPEPEPEPELEPEADAIVEAVAPLPVVALAEPEPELEPKPVVLAPVAEPEPVREPEPVVEPVPVAQSDADPQFEDVVSRILAPPPVRAHVPEPTVESDSGPENDPKVEPVAAPGVETVADPVAMNIETKDPAGVDDDVSSELVWPSDAPLQELSDLAWPVSMSQDAAVGSTVEDFVIPEAPPRQPVARPTEPLAVTPGPGTRKVADWAAFVGPSEPVEQATYVEPAELTERPVTPVLTPLAASPAVAPQAPVKAPVPDKVPAPTAPPAPTTPTIVIMPLEGSTSVARKIPLPGQVATDSKPVGARADRRKRSRRFPLLRVVATVVLLALLATAVALVLAQSAGAIHFGFLGPVG
jgi:hypothetical protein